MLNYAHRTPDQVRDPREDRLPQPIKYFVPTREKLPKIFGSRQAILDYFSSESHKRRFLETIVYYKESLQDIYTIIDNMFAS